MNNRARQFMPFAALKGYYDAIRERNTVFESRKELSEDESAILSKKLSYVKNGCMIKVTYYKEYIADDAAELKGRYITVEGMVSAVDEVFRSLTIVKTKIMFDDILDINGNCIPSDDF